MICKLEGKDFDKIEMVSLFIGGIKDVGCDL